MLPAHLRVLYLHGFASSPESRKARFFSERLRQHGFHVEVPNLTKGDFSKLTITGQLQVIEEHIGEEPAILIGSSLGGYLAALYANSHPSITRLILLAPAFRFYQLWIERITRDQLARWKQDGFIPVFHYGAGRELPLGYQFLEDAERCELEPSFTQPVLIFHGTYDDVVPLKYSSAWADLHPNARLVPLPSGHELTDVLEPIWQESESFLLKKITKLG